MYLKLKVLAPIRFREMEWRRTIVVASVVGNLTALAIWFGEPEAAFPLAVGSLFTGLGGIGEAPGHRWRIMLWTDLWVGLAAILGGLMSNVGLVELVSSWRSSPRAAASPGHLVAGAPSSAS